MAGRLAVVRPGCWAGSFGSSYDYDFVFLRLAIILHFVVYTFI